MIFFGVWLGKKTMEEKITSIMRKSIFIFLKYFHYFSTKPLLLLLPFSASVLMITKTTFFYSNSSPFPTSHAAGFPAFSKSVLLFLYKTNLSQTFFFSVLIIPFSLSSFLIGKASIIQALENHHEQPSLQPFTSCFSLYKRLLLTHLCNMVLSITANMVSIFILFTISGWFLDGILQQVTRTVLLGFLTNTIVVCNLALVVSGIENCHSYRAVYRAFLLARGTNPKALFLALPTHLGLASIEALFCYRVVKNYDQLGERPSFGMALEGMFISFLYSIVIVIDTIACWVFLKSCKSNCFIEGTNGFYDGIKLAKEEDNCSCSNLKILVFP